MASEYRGMGAEIGQESTPVKVKEIERKFKEIIEEGLEQSHHRGSGGRS